MDVPPSPNLEPDFPADDPPSSDESDMESEEDPQEDPEEEPEEYPQEDPEEEPKEEEEEPKEAQHMDWEEDEDEEPEEAPVMGFDMGMDWENVDDEEPELIFPYQFEGPPYPSPPPPASPDTEPVADIAGFQALSVAQETSRVENIILRRELEEAQMSNVGNKWILQVSTTAWTYNCQLKFILLLKNEEISLSS
ncbi:hypothetical protein Tco_1216936 [Tanacetum coccineum]